MVIVHRSKDTGPHVSLGPPSPSRSRYAPPAQHLRGGPGGSSPSFTSRDALPGPPPHCIKCLPKRVDTRGAHSPITGSGPRQVPSLPHLPCDVVNKDHPPLNGTRGPATRPEGTPSTNRTGLGRPLTEEGRRTRCWEWTRTSWRTSRSSETWSTS